MPSVSFGIDASGALRGAEEFRRAVLGIKVAAAEVVQQGQAIQRASGFEQQFAQKLRAVSHETRELTRQVKEREAAERRLLSLQSRLGDKFPEERAISQKIIAYRDLDRAVAAGLVNEQRRIELSKSIESNFSAEAVAARSLRANMVSLAATSGLLPPQLEAIILKLQGLRSALAATLGVTVGGGSGAGGGGIAASLGFSAAGLAGIAAAAVTATAAIVGLGKALSEAAQSQDEVARISAIIRATGAAAGLTAEQVEQLGDDIAVATGIAGESIAAASARLLTFQTITGDTFERALRAATDMGVIFGSTETAALALGKALESPAEGLAALVRIGVRFSDAQKEQIQLLVDTGREEEARAIIIERVEGKMQGLAEAAGQTLTGSYRRLKQASAEMLDEVGKQTGIIPFLTDLMRSLADAARDAAKSMSAVGGESAALARRRDQLFGPAPAGGPSGPDFGNVVGVGTSFSAARAAEAVGEAFAKVREEVDPTVGALKDYNRQLAIIAAQERVLGKATDETRSARAAALNTYQKAIASADDSAKALEKEAKAHEKAIESLSDYTAELTNKVVLSGLDERAQAGLTAAQEAFNRAVEAGIPGITEYVEQSRQLALTAFDREKATRDAAEAQKKADADLKRQAEQAEDLLQKPFKNFAEGVQRSFADTFRRIFDDGISSFSDLFSRVKDLALDLAAELAALLVIRPILAPIAGGLGIPSVAGAGTGGGLFGNVLGGGSSTATGGLTQNLGFFGSIANLGRNLGGGLTQSLLPVGLQSALTGSGLHLATINTLLNAFTPLAGIGGLVGSLGGNFLLENLGFTNASPFATGAGGIAGGLGGALVGAAIGGPFAPITAAIGALIGSFLGTTIPGLLGGAGDKKRTFILGPEGEFLAGSDRYLDFQPDIKKLFDGIWRGIGEILSTEQEASVRAALEGFSSKFQFHADEEGKLAEGINLTLGAFFERAITGLGDFDTAALKADIFAASGGTQKGVAEGLLTALGDAAQLMNAIAAFSEEAKPISESAAAIRQINETFEQLTEKAEELHAATSTLVSIETANVAALKALGKGFSESLSDQLLAIKDPRAFAERQLERDTEALLLNIRDLVFGGALTAQQGFAEAAKAMELAGLGAEQLAKQFDDLKLQSVSGLQAFVRDLTQGPQSTFSAADRLGASRSGLGVAVNQAAQLGGSEGIAFLNSQLPAILQNTVGAAGDLFGVGSSAFFGEINALFSILGGLQKAFGFQLTGIPTDTVGPVLIDLGRVAASHQSEAHLDSQALREEVAALRAELRDLKRALALSAAAPAAPASLARVS